MKNRSELREVIMKVLYQVFLFQESKLEYNLDDLIHEQLEVENTFVDECVHGVLDNQENLRKMANDSLQGWPLDRLNKVDQAILLLGIYELIHTDTPSVVCINEAIELSKKYSDEAVTKMINGVLDNIYHNEDIDER